MKNLKYLKYVLSLSLLICVGYFYAMKRGYGEVSSSSSSSSSSVVAQCVETYFVPRDQVEQRLRAFISEARTQILVAVYWITYRPIVNLLIAKKRQGKNVQVIIDESNLQYLNEGLQILLDSEIPILIYPSQTYRNRGIEIGFMHNKFVVIDGEHVFTGSANFTGAGLGAAEGGRNNYENVVVIHDRATAQKYVREFEAIKNYIHALETSSSSDEGSSDGEFALSQQQINFLRAKGYPDEEIVAIQEEVSEMNSQQIYDYLGNLPSKRASQTTQDQQQAPQYPAEESAVEEYAEEVDVPSSMSANQINMLRGKGYTDYDILGIQERVSGWSSQAIFNYIGRLPYKRRPQPAYGN